MPSTLFVNLIMLLPHFTYLARAKQSYCNECFSQYHVAACNLSVTDNALGSKDTNCTLVVYHKIRKKWSGSLNVFSRLLMVCFIITPYQFHVGSLNPRIHCNPGHDL